MFWNVLVSVLRSQQLELEVCINNTYGIFHQSFKVYDNEVVPVEEIIPCLNILSKKTENDYANNRKLHRFVEKTKKYLKKSKRS